MIPNPEYNYPNCASELTPDQKKKKAEEIFQKYGISSIEGRIEDYRIASLIGYKVAVGFYKDSIPGTPFPEELAKINQLCLPIRYIGGDMCFGRLFSINHCAFSSHDSIIGFRNSEYAGPQQYFKIMKGLKYVGTLRNWVLFKLDRDSTDDMTGVLYSALEKNFTIEFAHFPHDSERRIIYRWEDS